MTGADLLPATVLKRKAVVYVRQSTQTQVQTNLESQRRQYDLVDEARNRGFRDVEVIDDDLGRSASGTMARPGFDRLVAWLCAGDVGAVLCFDASRLARNGRDWHHLLELCGLVGARVIDLDGVYDPCRPNDRLLLGMKGSISEFELGVLRARMYDAARSKARRGELRISVPVGYVWDREMGLGFDPDMRLQEAIRLIFARFRELGSARQVLLSLAADQLHFPRPSDGKRMIAFDWTPIRYRNVISVLKNPFYAGAYIYGKSEHRTAIVNGRAQKTYGHGKPFDEWEVVLKDHHEGYRLGRVRAEPEAARGERLRPCRRGQIRSWRPGAAGRSASLRPMWPSPQGRLLWTQGTRLSLRQSKPYARRRALPDLWQFARRFGPCP
jgi:DNA invertase Pin-like site-specific DNA recombinase